MTESSSASFIPSEAGWRRELRERQSRWRETKGFAKGHHRGHALGSRLAMPEAEELLWNFVTPAIGQLVRREYQANRTRSGGERKVYGYPRLFDNLLSSQPMVFNLFGELALDLELATSVGRQLWPGRVERITRIEFEWSPGRADPRYTGHRSAADVALFHTTPGGGRGIIMVETKYHEDLSGQRYPLTARARAVADLSGAFLTQALGTLGQGRMQQLWLDHVLALATQQVDGLECALFVLIHPEINHACRDVAEEYRSALSDVGATTFEVRTLEQVVEAMSPGASATWVREFAMRYLARPGL